MAFAKHSTKRNITASAHLTSPVSDAKSSYPVRNAAEEIECLFIARSFEIHARRRTVVPSVNVETIRALPSASAMMVRISMVHPVSVQCSFDSHARDLLLPPFSDPCLNITCGSGVCTRNPNATNVAICSCPLNRKGEFCEQPNGRLDRGK